MGADARTARRPGHRALDTRHVGAAVGEQHARELDRADAGEFNDPDPGQWPAHRRASEASAISAHLYI